MSASREKKQRTASTGNSLTDKQRREAAAASKAKAMTVLYSVIGVVVAVLVILLILWNNGVFTKGKVVATVGGENFTVAQLGYYYYPNVRMYQQYGMTVDDATAETLRQQALDTLHQYASIAAAAKAEGRALSDEGKTAIDDNIKQIKTYASQQGTTFMAYVHNVYGPYMNEKTLRGLLEMDTLAQEYYTSYADSLDYSDAQIGAYYDEHAADLDSFTYSAAFLSGKAPEATDDQGNAVETSDADQAAAMSAAKAAAEKLAEEGKAGDFDALAGQAADGASGSNATPETTVLGASLANGLNADCKTWLTDAARKSGDTTAIEVEGEGYWVLKFDRRFLNEKVYGDVDLRIIPVLAEAAEGASAPTEEALAAAKTKAQGILDQFNAGDKTAAAFSALAMENAGEDAAESSDLYEHVTTGTSGLPISVKNWALDESRAVGDAALVDDASYGSFLVYLDKQNELQWRYTAVNALKSDDLTAWTDGIESSYAIESNEANLALVK